VNCAVSTSRPGHVGGLIAHPGGCALLNRVSPARGGRPPGLYAKAQGPGLEEKRLQGRGILAGVVLQGFAQELGEFGAALMVAGGSPCKTLASSRSRSTS